MKFQETETVELKKSTSELKEANGVGETTQKSSVKTTQKTTQKILELIAANPGISRIELAAEIGIAADGIKYQLNKMRKEGILKRVGPDIQAPDQHL